MDPKEEIIDDMSDVEDITPDKKIEEVVENLASEPAKSAVVQPAVEPEKVIETAEPSNPINPASIDNSSGIINDNNEEKKDDVPTNEVKDDDVVKEEVPTNEQEQKPKKKKAPLIILLSILLVLDVAALVIYMIGIDKVLSFIK